MKFHTKVVKRDYRGKTPGNVLFLDCFKEENILSGQTSNKIEEENTKEQLAELQLL